jgi:hypothetical protein
MKSGNADHYLGIQNQFLNRKLKGYPSVIFLWDFREVKKKVGFLGGSSAKRLENQHEDFRGSRWIEQLDGDLLTGCSLIYLRLEILEIKLNIRKVSRRRIREDTFS